MSDGGDQRPAIAKDDAMSSSLKRPSPATEGHDGDASNSSASDVASSSKGMQSTLLKETSATPDRDPYAFDNDNSSRNTGPNLEHPIKFSDKAETHTAVPEVEVDDVPDAEAENELDPSTGKRSSSPRVKTEATDEGRDAPPSCSNMEHVDTVMGGTDANDDPSMEAALPPHVRLRPPHKLKRLREMHDKRLAEMEEKLQPKKTPSADEQARSGLRRALVLALDHVGFSSATSDALESFLLMTETYLHSLVKDVTHFSLAARRTQAIPLDFDASLARFNLSTAALQPHLRNPVPSSKRNPTYVDPTAVQLQGINDPELLQQLRLDLLGERDANADLPLLSRELSGKADKDSKTYIPSGFPDFPSIHTYRHTPVDVNTVTVRGNGLRYADDGSPVLLSDEEQEDESAEAEASSRGPGGLLRRDPKRIREAAAVEAKQAEEALRSLLRASKVHKLKEVRAASNRNMLNKKRYTLWETAMRDLIQDTKGSRSAPSLQPKTAADTPLASLREEIADQSMMVNAEKVFHRREIPRKIRKATQKTG